MLARQLLLILLVKLVELLLIALLQLLELLVLRLDLCLLLRDHLLLPLDRILHALALLVLFVLVGLHVRLQVLLDLLDVVDFGFLLLEEVPGLLKL